MKMTMNEMFNPVLIFRGGNHRPERCEGYTMPDGTVIYSNRKDWQAASRGKSVMKAYAFTTKKANLLYAIEP